MQSEIIQSDDALDVFLGKVSRLMVDTVLETPLRAILDGEPSLGSGKMLRARIAGRLAESTSAPLDTLLHAAAAVEMVHAASLLHDDVIDGGFLRRNHPAFWVERGVSGAILLGDLLLFKALELVGRVEDGRLTRKLITLTGDVCQAESEQELIIRGQAADWDTCVRIARGKTGALFAFVAWACAGTDPVRQAILLEAGFQVGTAYQLADDILDATGDHDQAGKTLGTDASRQKTTAMRVTGSTPLNPAHEVRELCRNSGAELIASPSLHQAWTTYLKRDLGPALDPILAPVS